MLAVSNVVFFPGFAITNYDVEIFFCVLCVLSFALALQRILKP
jgi:hypothetical protein